MEQNSVPLLWRPNVACHIKDGLPVKKCVQKWTKQVNVTCNKHDLKTWCKRLRVRSANSRLICRIWKIQKSRRETIRTSWVHLNDQGTLTETTKATTSSNWSSILERSWDSTLHQCQWVFWSTTKSSTCSCHLVYRLLTSRKSSKHHNCRGDKKTDRNDGIPKEDLSSRKLTDVQKYYIFI